MLAFNLPADSFFSTGVVVCFYCCRKLWYSCRTRRLIFCEVSVPKFYTGFLPDQCFELFFACDVLMLRADEGSCLKLPERCEWSVLCYLPDSRCADFSSSITTK